MRRQMILSILATSVLVVGLLLGCRVATDSANLDITDTELESCTIFAASYGDRVLFGNNEDWNTTDCILLFEPPSVESTWGGGYGVVYWGTPWVQGGMNEKGLCFDWNALPEVVVLNPHPELPWIAQQINIAIIKGCSTVTEAIDMAKSYNWGKSPMTAQLFLADATGDAVVISAGADGELAFTRKPKGNGYLVSTNFNLANLEKRTGWYPSGCYRYDTATEMLEKIQSEDTLTVDYFWSILDAVHQGSTTYSIICEPRSGNVYLYYQFFQRPDYDKVIAFNLTKELVKGTRRLVMDDLYSQELEELPFDAVDEDQTNSTIIIAGVALGLLAITGLIVFAYMRMMKRRSKSPALKNRDY